MGVGVGVGVAEQHDTRLVFAWQVALLLLLLVNEKFAMPILKCLIFSCYSILYI